MSAITLIQTFTIVTCSRKNCGISFALTDSFIRIRRSDRQSFYCPNGHSQWYPGETDETKIQKLTGQLDQERSRVASERRMRQEVNRKLDYQTRARKAVSTRLKKVKVRVGNGVCPCCNRTFSQLANHMASEHPHYAKDVIE